MVPPPGSVGGISARPASGLRYISEVADVRTYHVYRNGLPTGPIVSTAGTPVWGGHPMLPSATTSLETAGLVVDLQPLAGQGETGDEE